METVSYGPRNQHKSNSNDHQFETRNNKDFELNGMILIRDQQPARKLN